MDIVFACLPDVIHPDIPVKRMENEPALSCVLRHIKRKWADPSMFILSQEQKMHHKKIHFHKLFQAYVIMKHKTPFYLSLR